MGHQATMQRQTGSGNAGGRAACDRTRRSRRAGLTLVETVLSIGIMGLFMGGTCAVLLRCKQLNDRARVHYAAVNIAKSRLELARTYEYDLMYALSQDDVVVDKNGVPGSGDYRISTVITPLSSNLTEIAIDVEVLNRITRRFDGERESVRSYVSAACSASKQNET